MKYLVCCFCFGLILLFNTGCTNVSMIRVQELREVQSHVDSLKIELTDLQKEILVKEKKQEELLRLLRAEQQANFQEIERRLSILYGNISESQSKLSQINKKTHEIKKRWEEQVISDSLNSVEKSIEIQKIFDIALNDFTAGRYSIALKSFTDITTKYPDSPHAEDSHYWIAECYYVQKKYNDSVNKYKEYIKRYNNGSKVCISLYKLGLAYKKMNQTKAMKLVWNKLVAQCPNSEEAQAAKSIGM